jgi:hypothetical protein
MGACGFSSSSSRKGPFAGSFEHGNEHPVAIKGEEFLTSWATISSLNMALLHESSLVVISAQIRTIGVLGFDSQRVLGNFLFTTASRTALGPTQPPIQWLPGALSLEVKRPGRETDHSPPSSAEVKECVELYFHSPIRLHGVVHS